MGILLDLIIVAIIAFFVYTSAKRGFVRTVIELVGFFLALHISMLLSTLSANFVYDSFVKQPLLTQIDQKIDVLTIENPELDYNKMFNTLPELFINSAENYGLSAEGLETEIKAKENNTNYAEILIDYAAKPIVVNVVKLIVFIILFLVLSIIVRWLARVVNRIFNIPIIGGLNKTLGAVFGLVKGTVVAAAICIAITMLISFTKNGFLIFTVDNIESTYLFKFLSAFSPLK